MSLYQDRQIKGFLLFLTLFALLFVGTATVLTIYQVNDAEVLWLKHDEAVSSSLLEQGVPKEVVAVAFTNTDISDDGRSLLAAAGLGKQSESSMRPYFNQFLSLYRSEPVPLFFLCNHHLLCNKLHLRTGFQGPDRYDLCRIRIPIQDSSHALHDQPC